MKRLALCTLTLLALVGCANLSSSEEAAAEAQARTYLKANFPSHEIMNVSCKGRDSDTDGYVRCNVSVKDATGTSTPNIECAYGRAMSWAEGCQQPKAGSN